jgi:hypothetical protein
LNPELIPIKPISSATHISEPQIRLKPTLLPHKNLAELLRACLRFYDWNCYEGIFTSGKAFFSIARIIKKKNKAVWCKNNPNKTMDEILNRL